MAVLFKFYLKVLISFRFAKLQLQLEFCRVTFASLPHRDPGQVNFWARTNGNITLSIVSGVDPRRMKLVGYPYGSIPRLILFWMTTEALRTR